MKKAIFPSTGLCLAVLLSNPVTASEINDFHAFSQLELSTPELISDSEMAAVEGGAFFSPNININIDINLAVLSQFNVCGFCLDAGQYNFGFLKF